MVRVSDARMSGTAFGTIVLHVTPDAASGGLLGLVRNRRPHQAVGQGASGSIFWSMTAELKKRAGGDKPAAKSRRAVTPGFMRRKFSAPTKAAISDFSGRAERMQYAVFVHVRHVYRAVGLIAD